MSFCWDSFSNGILYNTHKVIDLTVRSSLKIMKYCNRFKKTFLPSEIYGEKSYKLPFFENDDRFSTSSIALRDGVIAHQKLLWSILSLPNLNKKRAHLSLFRLFNVYGKGLEGRVVDWLLVMLLK